MVRKSTALVLKQRVQLLIGLNADKMCMLFPLQAGLRKKVFFGIAISNDYAVVLIQKPYVFTSL